MSDKEQHMYRITYKAEVLIIGNSQKDAEYKFNQSVAEDEVGVSILDTDKVGTIAWHSIDTKNTKGLKAID